MENVLQGEGKFPDLRCGLGAENGLDKNTFNDPTWTPVLRSAGMKKVVLGRRFETDFWCGEIFVYSAS